MGALDTNVYAVQHSTFMNISTNTVNGIQLAGLFNIGNTINGVQASGLFNIAGDVNGAAVSGLFNTGELVNGFQASGLFNTAKEVHGIQATGLMNSADEVNGLQASGLINVARKVHGVQLGVVNVAESSDGIALGVFNFIKDGMHHVGMNWDTNDMFDIFFQSGTKHLFITLGAAVDRSLLFSKVDSEDFTYIMYAGFGTELRFGFSSLDFEFLMKNVYNESIMPKDDKEAEKFNYNQLLIPSVRITFNALSLKHFDLSLGVSFDFRDDDGQNDLAFQYTNHRFREDDDSDVYPALFLGFKIK